MNLVVYFQFFMRYVTKKDQIESMKSKEERMEKQINELQQQNGNLAQPLKEANQKLLENTKKISNWENLKRSLAIEESKVRKMRKEMEKTSFELEALKQKLKIVNLNIFFRLMNNLIRIPKTTEEKQHFKSEYGRLMKSSDLNKQINEIIISQNKEIQENRLPKENAIEIKNKEIRDLKGKLKQAIQAHDNVVELHNNFKERIGYNNLEYEMKPFTI